MKTHSRALLQGIAKAEPFKYLSLEDMHTLLPFCQHLEFPARHLIMAQGKPGRGLYILLKGRANVSVNRLGHGLIPLATLNAHDFFGHDFFGEVVLIDHGRCSATVITDTPCTCLYLNTLCYDAFLIGYPRLRTHISQAIVEKVLMRQKEMEEALQQLMISLKQPPSKSIQPLHPTVSKPHPWPCQPSTSDLNALKELPLFHYFSDKEFQDFLHHAQCVILDKRNTLIHEHAVNHCVYFILDGSVQISIRAPRHHYKLAVLGPNQFIFPTAFLNAKDNDVFHVQTNDDTVLLQLSVDYFSTLAETTWAKYFDVYCQAVVALQTPLNHLTMRLINERLESIGRL